MLLGSPFFRFLFVACVSSCLHAFFFNDVGWLMNMVV
jgi:hypothetical protein